MLISDDVLFLHVPKTGGLSVTNYLVNNLIGPVTLSVGAKSDPSPARRYDFEDVAERVTVYRGGRHEDMRRAGEVLAAQGRRIADFALVLAMIRNPYDLEVSYYEHLRKPRVAARRGAHSRPVQLAAAGDFEVFVRQAPFYGRLPAQMERWYALDGGMPGNLRLVRFESLATDLPAALAPFSLRRWELPHLNASEERRPYRDYLTRSVEPAIFEKYGFLFDYYPRHALAADC